MREGWIEVAVFTRILGRCADFEIHKPCSPSFSYRPNEPRKTWLEATCPVFIDFGTDLLVRLETYDETGLPCVRHVARELFVRDALSQESAQNIGRLSAARRH